MPVGPFPLQVFDEQHLPRGPNSSDCAFGRQASASSFGLQAFGCSFGSQASDCSFGSQASGDAFGYQVGQHLVATEANGNEAKGFCDSNRRTALRIRSKTSDHRIDRREVELERHNLSEPLRLETIRRLLMNQQLIE